MNTSDLLDTIRSETRGQDCFFERLESARQAIGDFWPETLTTSGTDLDFLSAQYAQVTKNTNSPNTYPLWY